MILILYKDITVVHATRAVNTEILFQYFSSFATKDNY